MRIFIDVDSVLNDINSEIERGSKRRMTARKDGYRR